HSVLYCFFFFSSRRRHTRSKRDWSSDVCSSDLVNEDLYIPINKLSSFRAWTTRVSNPVCSPRFRASASMLAQVAAFAIDVPSDIYAFHRYTRNSATLYHILVTQYQMQFPG